MPTDLEKEKESIDGYLNTATIALIAGFFILFSITKFNSLISFWLAIISLSAFILTLLYNFWYRFRKTLKKELLEEKLNDCLEKELEVFTTYAEMIASVAEQKFLEIYSSAVPQTISGQISEIQKKLGRKDLDEKFDIQLKQTDEKNRPVLKAIIENLFAKIQDTQSNVLKKPLKEKNGILKFYLDMLAFKTRHFLFVFGLILFLASLIFNNVKLP